MARAIIILAVLLLGGCVSANDKGVDLSATPSRSRYSEDPDKPKQVCESTTEGTEAKTICY